MGRSVFDYRSEDISNTIAIDPLFLLLREGVVTSRYEMMAVLKHDGWTLHFASDELKGDRHVVMAAVKENGMH